MNKKNKFSTIILLQTILLFFNVKTGLSQVKKDSVIVLQSVTIVDSILKTNPCIKSEITKEQLQTETTRDVGDYLRSIPNVSGVRKGGIAVDPVIRGLKFSQLNVVLDNGVKIENGCPNRMDPVSSHIEIEDIEKIELIKGPYMLKYGSSLGGFINLSSEQPKPYDKFEVHAKAMYGFETNWNGQKEHISIYGGNKKVYFLLSGAYRNYGNYESGNLECHDTTFNSSFKKYNYSAKIGFSPKANQSLILSLYEIHGRDVLYPALPMDEKSDDTRIISLDYSIKNLSKFIKTLDVKVYQSNVDHVMDNSKRTTWNSKQMISDVNATNTGGRIETGMQTGKHVFNSGFDFESINKDGTRTMTMQMMGTTSTKKSNLWKDASIQNAGVFVEDKIIFKSSTINASLRADFNNAISEDTLLIVKNGVEYFNNLKTQFVNISSNLGITKKITTNFSVSLAIGRGTRSPNMLERFIKLMAVGYDNYDYLGNPQLKPEINNEADLTFVFSKQKYGNLSANAFYSYVQNFISADLLPSSVIKPQTQGVLGVKQFVNTDYVTFKGFEFGYTSSENYKLGASIIAAYTYAEIPKVTKYIVQGTQVVGSSELNNDPLSEIPPFEATAGINYKFLKGKLIPKIALRLVANQNNVSEAMYEQKTSGFGLINLSVRYKINKFSSLTTGVNNIFDRSYYEHLNRKIIGTTAKLYEPGRVFFINIYLSI
ncbi:MAG: TonB-dependent receptor [Bacteroidota bacterium]